MICVNKVKKINSKKNAVIKPLEAVQLLLQPHFEHQICILGSLLSCAVMQ